MKDERSILVQRTGFYFCPFCRLVYWQPTKAFCAHVSQGNCYQCKARKLKEVTKEIGNNDAR